MKRVNTVTALVLALGMLLTFGLVAGCSDDGGSDNPPVYDGDVPDGDDVTDGDTPDGDTVVDGDQVVDGDTDGDQVVDGDDEQPVDGDTTALGSIAGTIHASAEMAAYDAVVQLFETNPFVEWGTTPIAQYELTGNAAQTEKNYIFENLTSNRYYLWVYIDVANDDVTDNDVFAVYPEIVTMVAEEEDLAHRTGIDMFVDAPNAAQGSISGDLVLSQAYDDKRIVMIATENLPGSPDYWPNAIDFVEPTSGTRSHAMKPFSCTNLTDGTYHLLALVDMGDVQMPVPAEEDGDTQAISVPLAYQWPHEPLTIDLAGTKDHTDADFYIGAVDPEFGSVEGTLELPTALAGDLAVYVFGSDIPEEGEIPTQKPLSLISVYNDGASTMIPYAVGNLKTQEEVYVAGFLRIDDTHLALGVHNPGETPLSIDIEDAGKTHLQNVDIHVPITEISGQISVTSDNDPAWARVVLADVSVDIMATPMITVNDFGGGTDVQLIVPDGDLETESEATSRGTNVADFTMFPVKGGDWNVIVVLDTDLEEGISDGDQWCFQWSDKRALVPKRSVDGTQLEITGFDISVDTSLSGGWLCSAPPAQK